MTASGGSTGITVQGFGQLGFMLLVGLGPVIVEPLRDRRVNRARQAVEGLVVGLVPREKRRRHLAKEDVKRFHAIQAWLDERKATGLDLTLSQAMRYLLWVGIRSEQKARAETPPK